MLTGLGAFLVLALLVAFVAVLFNGAQPTIQLFGFRFLTIQVWVPASSNPAIPGNIYGIVPFAIGTLLTSAIALALAIPLSLGAAVFLTQQAPTRLRGPVGQLIELLAAIPSIIYGFWGLIVLVPIMRYDIEPALQKWLGFTGWFNGSPTGLDVLTASVILAVMIIPTITAISRDSIAAVPVSQKEAALSVGATQWETTRHAVLPYARGGIFAAIILGLGRALGETMAVTLVIGNRNAVPTSLLSQGQTIASLLANQFAEASGPIELSALIEAGLILLLITLAINVGARVALSRFERGRGVGLE
ncbi:MAG: phosphate ABC transporter permease subunit PstC [Thermoplasmata archaeon]